MVIVTLILGAFLAVVARLGMPEDYLFEVTTFSRSDDQGTLELPKAEMGTHNGSVLSGRLDVPMDISKYSTSATLFAYVPKFEGRLEIMLNGITVFVESSPADLGASGFALIPVPVAEKGVLPRMDFRISEKSKKFVLLSSVFLGSEENFAPAMRAQHFAQFLRVLVLGMNIIVFLMCIFFVCVGSETLLAASSLVISGYFLFSSLNSLNSFLAIPQSSVSLVVLCSPILAVNIWIIAETLTNFKRARIFWKAQMWSIFCAAFLIYLGSNVFESFRPFPTTVAIIFVALSAAIVATRSLIVGISTQNMKLLFFAMMLLLFLASTAHDIFIRFDFFGNNQYLLPFARVLFVFGCIYILCSFALSGLRQLRDANINLSKALDDRSNELEYQFAQTKELLRQEAISSEKHRVRQELDEELHDGVLSYISVINIITAESGDEKLVRINKLSRFATNEIRLMMETPDRRIMSLLAAISLLRRQFIDRLSEMGIEIEFDIVGLSECDELDYRVVVGCIRILQELVHNATVRAGSRHIEIHGHTRCVQDPAGSNSIGFQISVTNTGGNTLDLNAPVGSGIRNMKNRANRIGAYFSLRSVEGGATAILAWPATGATEVV